MINSHETMQAFLQHFDKQYGGVEEYVRRYIGFSDEELAIVKKNILTTANPRL
jgi:hypothetical protein